MWFLPKRRSAIDRFVEQAAKFEPYEIKKYAPLYELLRAEKTAVQPKPLGLRLLVLSDTHGYLAFGDNRFPNYLDTVGAFDLCILLGDIHPAEMPKILDCVPRERIVGIKGNHDPFSLYSDFGVRDISGEVFEYKGVRFAGIDGSFRYKNEPFPSHTQYESLAIAHRLPEADVLLTHDVMLSAFDRDPAHSGLIGITHYIYRNPVQWHLHGHIHQSYQRPYENGTIEKSVYQCEYFEI